MFRMKSYFFGRLTSLLATASMILSPVAQGAQAERQLQSEIKQFLAETSLSKPQTYQDFWTKNKHLFSGQIYKEAEKFFTQAPKNPMPRFTLTEKMNSAGETSSVLTLTDGKQSYPVQLIGEKEKFIKFNNVMLSENDVMLVSPAVRKLAASDIKIQKKRASQIINNEVDFKYPLFNKKAWTQMTPEQRARYFLNLRYLYSGALEVREVQNKKSKTSPKTSSLEKWNLFLQLLEPKAEAAGQYGEKCVVAGFIGTNSRGPNGKIGCQYPAKYVTSSCPRPCNATLYGYNTDGSSICISDDKKLQTATHFGGACDSVNPLTLNPLSLPSAKSAKAGKDRYKDIEEKNREEAREKLSDEQTKKFLASILNNKTDKTLYNLFMKGDFSTKESKDLISELISIQNNFNSTIDAARKDCAASAEFKQPDKEFIGACDQLHRRFLFVAEYLEKNPGCGSGKALNKENFTCPCEDGSTVTLGQQCVLTQFTPPPVGAGVSTPAVVAEPEVVGEVQEVKCDNGEAPKEDDGQKKCKEGFNWKPWLIGAGILGLAAWAFWPKKKAKPQPAPDKCPTGNCENQCQLMCASGTTLNPASCSCDTNIIQPICVAPKVNLNGVCSCPSSNACTPGQQIYNLNTCQCDTVAQPIICPDGVTQVMNAVNCPQATLCWNGTQVYPPNECPPKTEGGSGTNCPNGNCSGGVPTAQ